MANINEYRSRIQIYKRAYTTNSMGGFTQTMTLVDTVWCKVEPLTGLEEFRYQMAYAIGKYKVTMRYRPDVNTDMKLFYRKNYMDIISVQDVNSMRDELEIMAEVTHGEQT